MRKRAASFLVGMAAVLLVNSPVWPVALTSTVTDPVGDFFDFANPCEVSPCPPYQDIVRAEIVKRGGTFMFSLTVAEGIPDSPPLHPGRHHLFWGWYLDTNAETFPGGFPTPPGIPHPIEIWVEVMWDGTRFTAHVIDRRPLLTGEEAIVTQVPFRIKGADITLVVDDSLIADPSFWVADTGFWMSDLGSFGVKDVDRTAPVTWP